MRSGKICQTQCPVFSRASSICYVCLTGIYHWSLHWGCLAPGQPPWSCWRCGIGCPVQPGTAACSGGCWRLGTAGTSRAHIPPVPPCSVPVNQQQCSLLVNTALERIPAFPLVLNFLIFFFPLRVGIECAGNGNFCSDLDVYSFLCYSDCYSTPS